ncbi:MAG: hypothetical protein EBQ96_09595 [Proteobacteria bacterium]|nr:hypothetical protein [Pseudomonadota bacterium]
MMGMFLVNESLEVCFLQMGEHSVIDHFRYMQEQKVMVVALSNGDEEMLTSEIDPIIQKGLFASDGILVIDIDERFQTLRSYPVRLAMQP